MVNLSTRPNGPGPGARAAGHRPALQRYSGEVRRSHRRSSVWIFMGFFMGFLFLRGDYIIIR